MIDEPRLMELRLIDEPEERLGVVKLRVRGELMRSRALRVAVL